MPFGGDVAPDNSMSEAELSPPLGRESSYPESERNLNGKVGYPEVNGATSKAELTAAWVKVVGGLGASRGRGEGGGPRHAAAQSMPEFGGALVRAGVLGGTSGAGGTMSDRTAKAAKLDLGSELLKLRSY